MRRVPTLPYLLVSALLTAAFFVVCTPLYVEHRQAVVRTAWEKLNAEEPKAATEVGNDLASKGVPFPPAEPRPPLLAPETLDPFGPVARVEAAAREFNRAVGEVKKEHWTAGTTKAAIDARLLKEEVYPMTAGPFQASGLVLVVFAAVVLCRLWRDVGREHRAARRHPQFAGGDGRAVTPEMAGEGAEWVHAELKRDRSGRPDRERNPAYLVQAHHLLADFARTADPTAGKAVLADEAEQTAGLASARFAWVLWVIFAAPTLKLLATLFFMAEGMRGAVNPANLPAVVASISEGFSATIVSLLLLLPLMLAKHLVAARIARLQVAVKDAGHALVARFRTAGSTDPISGDAVWYGEPPVPVELTHAPPEPQRMPEPEQIPEPTPEPTPTARSRPSRSAWKRWAVRARGGSRRLFRRLKPVAAAGWRLAGAAVGLIGRGSLRVWERAKPAAEVCGTWLSATGRYAKRGLAAALRFAGEWFQRAAGKLNGPKPNADTPTP